jgi:hypothetical protein
MFSHEIDVLEIKLYEGLGIVDKYFIGESRYSHRGHKKYMFTDTLFGPGGRLAHFKQYVEIVDLDERCPKFSEATQRFRYMDDRPQIIWDTQDTAHECLTEYIRNYTMNTASQGVNNNDNNNNTLVSTSDLDEILYRETLASIKYCELEPSVVEKYFPIPVSTTYSEVGKLLCGGKNPSKHYIPGLLFRAKDVTGQRRPKPTHPNEYSIQSLSLGGIHLTYMGGSLVVSYKSTNHAEGGDLVTLGWLNDTYNPTVCESTRADWYERERLLCVDRRRVMRPWDPLPPKDEEQEEEYRIDVLPWILRPEENRRRYPCLFDNYKECADQYIDYIMK